MDDQFALERFVKAQAPLYQNVVAELAAGRKRSHWMWFIFPQIAGLGRSANAVTFALASSDEAAAYLAHPLLGARLRACSALVAGLDDQPIDDIFAAPDDQKFHSSMTLFAEVAPHEAVFSECLNKYFDGIPDQATIDRL